MAVERFVRYACDRCKDTHEVDVNEKQPSGWVRVVAGQPVLANPVEADKIADRVLCGDCAKDLWAFLDGRSVDDLEAVHG